MKIDNLTLETVSPLPLVPYFPHGGAEFSKELSREAARAISAQNGLAHKAVESVLRENFSRRVGEAHATVEAVRGELFADDGTFIGTAEELAAYTHFRCTDADPHRMVGQSLDVFTNPSHPRKLTAYEIFAHPRDPEDELHDLTFARNCLELISQGTATELFEHRLPKLSRRIDVDGVDQRVVTTKVSVGSFEIGEGAKRETIRLTSRQAGLLDYNLLNAEQQSVVDWLTGYNRSRGRTKELNDARANLQEILKATPAQPVVESLYLTRESASR